MRSTTRKMAEEYCEFLPISELYKDQLSIAVDLACSLRADDIEKFLETYDSIPESIETEQIDQIKEMARQLAALPIKQFDMYRTKARVMVSGEYFNSPLTSSMNIKENGTFGSANYIRVNACKNEGKIKMKTIPAETEENKVIGVKSKKKSKKKKRNSAVVSEKPGISNVEISSKNSKDSSQKQDFLITKKFLDPADQSTSRIATMNRTLVVDICSSDSQGMNSDETSNEIWVKKSKDIHNLEVHPKQKSKLETMDKNCSRDINDSYIHQSVPPFGFPLSASKLIQSAVGLLPSFSGATSSNFEHIDCKQNKDKNHVQQEKNASGSVRQSTSVEINGFIPINFSESHAKIDSISGDQLTSKTFDPHWETESVDGDISNLSALEDDGGWQSQVKRSNRKKKKELTGWNSRERTRADHKSKKNLQMDYKTSNFKKQNFKNSSDRNQSGTLEEVLDVCAPNNATKDDSDNGLSSKSKYEEKSRKQGDVKELFSYRDALLKTKSKPEGQEELQYNSDSGVDVNSVSSCDSSFYSSKTLWEFDVHEAVKFLIKGCDEVKVRHKQGGVHYYSQ